MSYPVSLRAFPSPVFGAKVGSSDYRGDVLPGSGDVGRGVHYGVFVGFSGLPILDLEVHADYFAKDFTYTYSLSGTPVSTDFEFRDVSVLILGKKKILGTPGGPLSLYVGGGLGWHLLNTELAKAAASGNFDPLQADNPFSLFSNNAKMAGHGLAGVLLSFPVIPVSFYGEGRYGRIFAGDGINLLEVEAGIRIGF
jgi:hypothetical protein